MRSILFFICLIFTFEGQAQEVEKSHMWKVELSGALNNNSAWEVEPSVTYLPIPYVGITMGLLFCNTIENKPLSKHSFATLTNFSKSGCT